MVIYDVIDGHIKTIRRISANNIESYLADITEIKFQISKSMIITGGLVVITCRMILLYEGRVANILLGKTCGLDCSTGFMAGHAGFAHGHPHIEGLRATSQKCC